LKPNTQWEIPPAQPVVHVEQQIIQLSGSLCFRMNDEFKNFISGLFGQNMPLFCFISLFGLQSNKVGG